MNNIKNECSFDNFLALDIRMGTIIEAEDFPKAKKPAYKLKIDFGSLGIKCSSAQITKLYKKEDLIGRKIVAIVNFPKKQIANFFSECLILGAIKENGEVALLSVNEDCDNGTSIG
ncbi:tRNA-binding protein [Brachyspira aalborgi]|uniref:tRNA-binding protein n=1 Tax=Brachyspira aalborgi TaxID=29522 RepID=A0A5C8EJR7_9SPIR|nr:tRNA-binding protein [Brachyspira aalborgi]TXJ38025.1 tRNA-binding protein [Brachyspira aalborgi]